MQDGVGFSLRDVFTSDKKLLKQSIQKEQSLRQQILSKHTSTLNSSSFKALDSKYLLSCYNDNIENKKSRFKIVLNSAITRGAGSYQYTGNRIDLSAIRMQITSNILPKDVVNQLQFERAFRFTLCFFENYDGANEQVPTWTNLFSGPFVSKAFPTTETQSTFYSEINPVFFDNVVVIYDRTTPLGSIRPTTDTSSPLVRSNGNFFVDLRFDLTGLFTTFYKDEILSPPNPLKGMTRNISNGILVGYFNTNFYDNPNKTDQVDFTVETRLEFSDA